MIRNILACVALTALFSATTGLAHSVWIEPDENKQLVIRFAEPSGNLERSPGHLDSLTMPVAFQTALASTNAPAILNVTKKTDHYSIQNVSATNIVGVEASFTVRAARKPLFYARWQPAGAREGKPLLTLDLVPTGKPGEVRLFLRGQPRGNVKATLMNPNGDEKEFTADAEGYIRFSASEPGQYLLTVAHQREPIAGVHLGVPYKETSHNCSLAWEQKITVARTESTTPFCTSERRCPLRSRENHGGSGARVLQTKAKAIVVPVLVAHDETFQIRIIGGGIAKVSDYQTRVVYRPDAILPDSNIEQWVHFRQQRTSSKSSGR